MTNLSEMPALITGASRGLGAALATTLAPFHHVVLVGRTVGALEEVDDKVKAVGGSATLAPLDITDDGAMQQLCRSIFDRWGGLALWLHTAIHAAPLAPAAHLAMKDFEKSVSVNVTATARLITFVTPLLGDMGQAVFFDDPRGGEKFFGAYGATKAAQMSLARSFAAETESIGPQVHILSPNPMPTATRARFFPGEERDDLISPAKEAGRLIGELPELT